MTLHIHPKFQKLLRPLSQDERQRLEWSILKDGILDAIKVWVHEDKTYIVDGHNRYDIFQKYTTDISAGYQTLELSFNSEDEVLEWIIENQLRRRNLTQNERVLYLGQLFEMRKKRRGGLGRGDEGGATAEQIAEEQDVSPRTVTRAAEVAIAYNEADKEMQEKFASGEISQAELLRSIRKKEEIKELKKDQLHNAHTNALAAIGERFVRAIRSLRHLSDDYAEVCKAIKIEPYGLVQLLPDFKNKLIQEEKEAEDLMAISYVGNLCPNSDQGLACKVCHGVQYVTAFDLEGLKKHFSLDEDKAQAA